MVIFDYELFGGKVLDIGGGICLIFFFDWGKINK